MIELSVRRHRQLGDLHKRRRHHVVRQQFLHEFTDVRVRERSRHHDVTNQPWLRSAIRPRNHRAGRDAFECRQHRLDFAELNAEAAELDLVINPPLILDHTRRKPAHQITAAIQPLCRTSGCR